MTEVIFPIVLFPILWSSDIRKIGYVGEQNNEVRFSGYKDALAKLGLPFLQKNTSNVHLSADGGYKGANILMHNKADISAIFCANDTTALGVIHALKEKIFEYRKIFLLSA